LVAALYVAANEEEFLALDWPSRRAVIIVAIAYLVNVALVSVYNKITAARLGADISFGESFMLSAVAAAGNFVLPVKVGAGLRALYMKKVHDFPIGYFAGGSIIFVAVTIVFVSLVAQLLLVVIYMQQGYFRADLFFVFPAIMIGTIVGLLVFKAQPQDTTGGHRSWYESFRGSLGAILGERKLLGSAIAIVALIFLFASLVWTVALQEYAPAISLTEAFLVAASQLISGYITLTPGATGFQELAALYVGRSFPATTTEIFAVLVWVRAVRVITALAVATPSAWLLRKKLSLSRNRNVTRHN
jgi:uncharacterized membrane protein YbhN (UPF0104 family)